MELIDALPRVHDEFEHRLRMVRDDQWAAPTPCEGWSVRDLVNHVVAGAQVYTALLDGCSAEVAATFYTGNTTAGDFTNDDILGDDPPLATYRSAAEAVTDAFQAPGALDRMCHYLARDMPGGFLLAIRINDTLVHTWDLARAIGADEALPHDLVEVAWQVVEPLLPRLRPDNGFKRGASGRYGDDAPLQMRWLDAQGRRPSPRPIRLLP
jgi:uncharacterized protein (TIGR03086 family)